MTRIRTAAALSILLCTWPVPGALAATGPGPAPLLARSDARYVESLHRALLGRAPRQQERSTALGELRKVPYRVVVQNRILDSAEFSRRVGDRAYLAGLFEQVEGRPPLAHEMVFGLHALGERVPRSELLGALLHRGARPERVTASQARVTPAAS